MTITEELRAMVRELADELEMEIRVRYPVASLENALVERRFRRDMEPVRRARELLRRAEAET